MSVAVIDAGNEVRPAAAAAASAVELAPLTRALL
jgi:hypothetical protein